MAYRRGGNFHEVYDERFCSSQGGSYPRMMNERRPGFGRPLGEYGRAFEYSEPRYCPTGGPRSYHDEDPRGYHPENLHPAGDRRAGPPRREESYHCYRGGRADAHGGHQGDFRDYRDSSRRKGSFPPQRDRSPFKRDVPHSPHSRSGSSLSSRSYSPEKGKAYYYQQRKNKDRPSSHSVSASRDGSPHSSTSTSKGNVDKSSKPPETQPAEVLSEKAEVPLEKSPDSCEAHADNFVPGLLSAPPPPCPLPSPQEVVPVPEGDSEEPTPAQDEVVKMKSDFQERRSQAIAARAREIEKVYRQDCETFGMVVKMLVAKEPSLEKQLQNPLKENLSEIRERCLEDLRHFISELDEVVLQPEASH